jgi:hypothetical protein
MRRQRLRSGAGQRRRRQPILLAAIHGEADYLLTGDARHFRTSLRKRIERLLVLRPAAYFQRRRRLEAAVSPHSFGDSID